MTEVLASLALLMACATGVLAVVLVTHQERILHPLLASALAREARTPGAPGPGLVPGTHWWVVAPDGAVRPRQPGSPSPDAESLELARRAREEGAAVLQTGGGGAIHFAAPLGEGGGTAVARLPAEASARLGSAPRRVALGVLLADALIFTAFGASVLRRRLVLPLRRLRDAAEAVARGDDAARVPEEGAAEAADLAAAFNAMNEALERRTGALEKAVADLRATNAELRQARAGLDRAERLAAVGRLAAGVAHEVGNPMGAVLAFLDLVSREPGLSAQGREHLARAAREGERVREILRQLLDFSRPARGAPARVDLVAAAEETVALVRAQRRYAGIEFQVSREGNPPPAWADPHVVSQVLLNLVLNAGDAVRGQPAGHVHLHIRPAALAVRAGQPAEAARRRRAPDAVECIVSDDGPGVADTDRERVFDPFFTTKEPGEGTGLGLANALRFAEEAGGQLELEPGAPGDGARFALRLPAAPSAAGDLLPPTGLPVRDLPSG